MNNSRSIKLKAAFLLTAFGLNTAIGFACSMGLDMGFNTKHHTDEQSTEGVVHIHKDGKKHIHEEEKDSHSKSHHHDEADNQKSQKEKDDCCDFKVIKIAQLDKSMPQSSKLIQPNFLLSFFDVFYSVSLPATDIDRNIKQFVRNYHPPIPDIRIAIQSFQI